MDQPDGTQRIQRQHAQQKDARRMIASKPDGDEHEHETESINRLTGASEKQRLQPLGFEKDVWHASGDHADDESRMGTQGPPILASEVLIRLD